MIKITFERSLILSIALIWISGCSNPLGGSKSSIDPGYGPKKIVSPATTGYETISGSQLSKSSSNSHFRIDTTVGASTKDIRLRTSRNKIVYLSVQGQMISK